MPLMGTTNRTDNGTTTDNGVGNLCFVFQYTAADALEEAGRQ
jgi:hypothetical protein